MWWKLGVLIAAAVVAIVAVIPIRTHAAKYDLLREPLSGPPPTLARLTIGSAIANMYLTPGTVALIVAMLLVAGWVAYRIFRAG